eukprot:m.220625 g.220625  ORF g.220625 m.220625 type:complete len:447 (-) comp18710_c0_seq7:37-1377(-)
MDGSQRKDVRNVCVVTSVAYDGGSDTDLGADGSGVLDAAGVWTQRARQVMQLLRASAEDLRFAQLRTAEVDGNEDDVHNDQPQPQPVAAEQGAAGQGAAALVARSSCLLLLVTQVLLDKCSNPDAPIPKALRLGLEARRCGGGDSGNDGDGDGARLPCVALVLDTAAGTDAVEDWPEALRIVCGTSLAEVMSWNDAQCNEEADHAVDGNISRAPLTEEHSWLPGALVMAQRALMSIRQALPLPPSQPTSFQPDTDTASASLLTPSSSLSPAPLLPVSDRAPARGLLPGQSVGATLLGSDTAFPSSKPFHARYLASVRTCASGGCGVAAAAIRQLPADAGRCTTADSILAIDRLQGLVVADPAGTLLYPFQLLGAATVSNKNDRLFAFICSDKSAPFHYCQVFKADLPATEFVATLRKVTKARLASLRSEAFLRASAPSSVEQPQSG